MRRLWIHRTTKRENILQHIFIMADSTEENQDRILVFFCIWTLWQKGRVIPMRKIVFLDIDGTIRDFDGTITCTFLVNP